MCATSRIALGKPAEEGEVILERRYRLAKKLSSIMKHGGVLLDVGCGNGAQTSLFLPHFQKVVGVDVQIDPMIGSNVPVSWVVAKGENLPFDDDSFDAIVCFEVLEHVIDPLQTLREFKRVMKPGGEAVISVPNKWWVFETHGADLPFLPWNRVPFFSWLPEVLHSRWARARIYTRRKLGSLMLRAGFTNFNIRYITAPMDRAKPRWLQMVLQNTIFSHDITSIPFLSVNHIAIIKK